MKNLKKVLALVLALSMILSTFTALTLTASAAAEPTFSDIAGTSYEDAVEVLAALDIVAGYEDGTYGGEKVVTRAEMAAFIVRELGLAATASSATSGNQYSDVAADHWALGSINVATNKKIIVGNGDGTFAPNDTVSYQAAVKMLVCALGREVEANRYGGWPSGYLIVAADIELTDGITGIDGADGCNRGVVAQLLFNALDIQTMEESQYSGSAVVIEESGKTLLRNHLNVLKLENAEIKATATQGDNKTSAGLALVKGEDKYYSTAYENANGYKALVGETDPDAFYGDAVIVYVKMSNNTNTPDTILCIVNDNVTQESMEINVADFYSTNPLLQYGETNTEATNTSTKYDRLYFKGEEDTKAQYAKLLSTGYFDGCELVINGVSDHDEDWTVLESAVLKNGTIKLIDAKTYDFATGDVTAGADGYYEKIILDTYLDFVVSEVDADESKILTVNDVEITLDDTVIYTLTDAEGNELKLEDLQENDVLSVFPDTWSTVDTAEKIVESSEVLKVVVYNNPIEGSVTETTKKAIFIDGTKYKLAGDLVKLSDFDLADEGTFYLNAAGDIVYADTTPAAKNYAVFYDVYADGRDIYFTGLSSDGTALELKARNEIEVVTYGVVDGVYGGKKDVDEYDLTKPASDATADDAGDAAKRLETATYNEGAYGAYIAKYTEKNGFVDTIYLAGDKKGATSYKNDRFAKWAEDYDAYYNAPESTFGSYMIDASTVIFDIPDSVTSAKDSDKIKILSKSGLKNAETYEGTDIYEVDKNNVVKAAIIHSEASDVDVKDPIAIIQAVSKAKNADGEDIYKIYMIQNGKMVVKESDDDKIFADYDETELEAAGYTTYAINVAYGVYPGAAIFYNTAADGSVDKIERIYPALSKKGVETDSKPYYTTEFYTTWNNSAHQGTYKEDCDALIIVGEVIEKSTTNKTITIQSTLMKQAGGAKDNEKFIANYASANITVVDYGFEEAEDIVAAGSATDIKARKEAKDGNPAEAGSLVLVRKQNGSTKDIVVYANFAPLTKPLV